jgi:hypothetical protein
MGGEARSDSMSLWPIDRGTVSQGGETEHTATNVDHAFSADQTAVRLEFWFSMSHR